MAQIPLPRGLSGSEKLPETRTELRNLIYTDQGDIIPGPGIAGLNAFNKSARGSFRWQDSFFGVWGNELYKMTDPETGAVSLIGTIAGSARIETAIGEVEAVIVVKGGSTYTLDTSDVLVDITGNANMQANVDVASIDQITVYIPSDGGPAYFSDPGDAGSIQPLSFFTAEELPDRNNGVFNLSNTLFITGTDSIEKFRNTGGTPNPFTRIQGSRQNYGFIGAQLEYTNLFLMIGREKDQDFGIYATSNQRTVKISNSAIDLILGTYSLNDLQQAVPGRVRWRGYDIATFTLARDSFGYLGGNWFLLDTLINGMSQPWLGGFITEVNTKYFTASKNFLGRFDEINTDFGNKIIRSMDFGFKHPNDRRFSCQNASIGISQGFNDEEGSVAILMSRDNVLYGPPIYRPLGKIGQYAKKLGWNPSGGLGNYDSFMGIRIYTTQNVHFAADSFYANVR